MDADAVLCLGLFIRQSHPARAQCSVRPTCSAKQRANKENQAGQENAWWLTVGVLRIPCIRVG